jgi:hypothetical protein
MAIVTYTPCARSHVLYVFSRDSTKCSKCTRKGVPYDRNFLEADFDKLSEEKARLEAIRTRALKEMMSLNRYIKVL